MYFYCHRENPNFMKTRWISVNTEQIKIRDKFLSVTNAIVGKRCWNVLNFKHMKQSQLKSAIKPFFIQQNIPLINMQNLHNSKNCLHQIQ